MVIPNYSVDIFGGERDKVGKHRWDRVWEDGGRGKSVVDFLQLPST